MKRAFLFIAIIVSLNIHVTGHVSAEEVASTPSEEIMTPGLEYFKGYWHDGKHIVTSPARWDADDWLKAGAVVGVTLGLYAVDEDIQEWFRDNRSEGSDNFTDYIEPFGNGLFLVPSLGVVYAYGYFSDNTRLARASLIGLESYVVSGLIVNAIKFTGHRHRPDEGGGAYSWEGPSFDSDFLSFPSGHSASAWSVAAVVASEYEENRYVAPIAYGIATLTALSRVHDDRHWTSDVFMGAAIGYFTGKTIHKLHSDSSDNMVLIPVINDDSAILVATFRF
ncbi:MAG: phosphatase PAP2 family protein [Nitrospirota bacterium]|nr:MAG: phosphatase PAP2 family protein [Nitrospirota bacterium]